MIADPPFDAGAVQETVACALPPVAVTLVGARGGPSGVTLFEAAEAGPLPAALVAVTVKVYELPLLRPVTMALVVLPPTELVIPPGDAVTV